MGYFLILYFQILYSQVKVIQIQFYHRIFYNQILYTSYYYILSIIKYYNYHSKLHILCEYIMIILYHLLNLMFIIHGNLIRIFREKDIHLLYMKYFYILILYQIIL